ncbi:MAG TPA: hypothetical protein VF744_07035 [Beijerinckiaceae bacterium]
MVDLVDLERIAAEDEDVRTLVHAAAQLRPVQGVTIRPHPLWVQAMWRQNHADRLGYRRDLDVLASGVLHPPDGDTSWVGRGLGETPDLWNDWLGFLDAPTRAKVEYKPILVTVIVRAGAGRIAEVAIVVDMSAVPAVIEVRPQAELQLATGDRIRVGAASGTAGGFLEDAAGGRHFAVTCAHVLGSVGAGVFDPAGAAVGRCHGLTTLAANNGGLACDPVARPSGLSLNTLDAGLVELGVVPAPTGLLPPSILRHGQRVTLALKGGAMTFHIRSLAISMQLTAGANGYCYASLVELHSAAGTTAGGDSGAWGHVLGGSGREWGVMAIGGDGISTFAVRAADVLAWAHAIVPGLTVH